MLKKEVLAGLNKQIQQELTASYGYLALSLYFDHLVLKGFSAYFRKQMAEEQSHAMKLLEYVQDSNEQVTLGPINPPTATWNTVLDAVKFAREAERNNTATIHALYQTALAAGDLASQNQLQWFIAEQVEEEKWAEEFVALVEKVGAHPGGLYMLDHHVSKRAEKE